MFWRRRCERKGHDWFPPFGPREFIPVNAICLRCRTPRTCLPYGQCLSGHPIAEHYDEDGHPIPHATCPGPH